MPVAADDNAGYDHNGHHSRVGSQQGILDGYHKVPHAPQTGAHICSCAEYLLEQSFKRVHRQQCPANERHRREDGATISDPLHVSQYTVLACSSGLHVTFCCNY